MECIICYNVKNGISCCENKIHVCNECFKKLKHKCCPTCYKPYGLREHKTFYKNKSPKKHCFYKKNKKHGEYKEWHPNGTLKKHCFYKDGKYDLTKKLYEYWSNGMLKKYKYKNKCISQTQSGWQHIIIN